MDKGFHSKSQFILRKELARTLTHKINGSKNPLKKKKLPNSLNSEQTVYKRDKSLSLNHLWSKKLTYNIPSQFDGSLNDKAEYSVKSFEASTNTNFTLKETEIYSILNLNKGFSNNLSNYFNNIVNKNIPINLELNAQSSYGKKFNYFSVTDPSAYNNSRINELLVVCNEWASKAVYIAGDKFKSDFWGENSIKGPCNRLKESNEFMEDMINVFDMRAKIEEVYSKEILEWTNILTDSITRRIYADTDYFMFGNIQKIFKNFVNLELVKALEHTRLCKNINEEISKMLLYYYNTQKMTINGKKSKEPKDLELEFLSARRKWTKLEKILAKVKNSYNIASNEYTKLQFRKKQTFQKKTIIELKLRKSEINASVNYYQKVLNKMNSKKNAIKLKMEKVLSKYTDFEIKRLKIYKMALQKYQQSSNYYDQQPFVDLNDKLAKTIKDFNPEKIMNEWSTKYGASQPLEIPYLINNTDTTLHTKDNKKY